MNTKMNTTSNEYEPKFQWAFLHPKHWGLWLAILFILPISLLPLKVHRAIARFIANKLANKRKSTILNVWVNLSLCFPDKSDEEKEELLRKTLTVAGTFLLNFPLVTLLGKRYLEKNTVVHGLEHLEEAQAKGYNILLLAPHSWPIDILPVFLASKGMPVAAMAKKQKNPIGDWLMYRQRVQFGGRIHERDLGVKPFLKSIREGFLGYYLPDQDHGRELSVFVDFFGVPKATLPGMGKLAKLSKAVVIPTFSRFNINTGQYEISMKEPWYDFPSGDELVDARRMNAFIEDEVVQDPTQYMWIFQLLRNRPDPTESNPYQHEKFKKKLVK